MDFNEIRDNGVTMALESVEMPQSILFDSL